MGGSSTGRRVFVGAGGGNFGTLRRIGFSGRSFFALTTGAGAGRRGDRTALVIAGFLVVDLPGFREMEGFFRDAFATITPRSFHESVLSEGFSRSMPPPVERKEEES
jgi:hypothetical protein